MIRHWANRIRRGSSLVHEDRGSMAILMMVVLVGVMISATLVPVIITQDRLTRLDKTRVQALDAAQAGIDVTLGVIRAGVTTPPGGAVGTYGDSAKLPCGPWSGAVTPAANASYSVVVEYFTFNPVNEPTPSARAMSCRLGFGTYDARSGKSTPGFARFVSTGTVPPVTNGSTTGRTLTTTYVFRTSNVNILGGLIPVSTSGALCIDAGSPKAPAGTATTLQPCSTATPPAAQQVFAYRTDLTLQLVSSITLANPQGLCLNSSGTPANPGDAILLSQCGPLGSPTPYTEQWSYNDGGQYQAAQETSVTTGALSPVCMGVSNQAASQPIVMTACRNAPDWSPSSAVGPGAAALPNWINYQEFGRCLDVTYQDPNQPFMIDFPCKQNPFPGALTWNQLFQAPALGGQPSATGLIITTYNGRQYCLTSPGSVLPPYVRVLPCDGRPQQTWTIYGGDKSLNYSTKYTIVSSSLCLGLHAPYPGGPSWSTIDARTCTGGTDQKWNAVANVLNSTLTNSGEK